MLRGLNKSLERQAKHRYRIGIPQRSHANPARNAAVEEARLTTEARVEEAEATMAQATAMLITSPKHLDYLQKTRACSGAIVYSSTVLATNRAYNKWT
jgi:hypothetical protein